MTSSLVPELLKRAEANDFQGLLALAMVNEGAGENMSVGMQLSVLCAEDYPAHHARGHGARNGEPRVRVAPAVRADEGLRVLAEGDRAGVVLRAGDARRCPVLLMSGDLDPVTPPTWAEQVKASLTNSRHVVVPGTGHGTITTGCGMRIAREFIEQGRRRRARHELRRRRSSGRRSSSRRRDPILAAPRAPANDPRRESPQAVRPGRGRRRRELHRRGRSGDRAARSERRRQDDDVAHAVCVDAARCRARFPSTASTRCKAPQEAQARLGVLPDVSGLYPRLTPREHLEYYGQLQGLAGKALNERIAAAVPDARHEQDCRSPHAGLFARRADEGGPGAGAGPRPAQCAARRADQRSRRDEHARRPRHHPPAPRRWPLRRVLEPRDAGSVGAVRRDHRDRARPHRRLGLRRTNCGSRPDTRASRMRSSRWPASSTEKRNDAARADRGRVPQGSEGRLPRSAVALLDSGRRDLRSADHRLHAEQHRRSAAEGRRSAHPGRRHGARAGAHGLAAPAGRRRDRRRAGGSGSRGPRPRRGRRRGRHRASSARNSGRRRRRGSSSSPMARGTRRARRCSGFARCCSATAPRSA